METHVGKCLVSDIFWLFYIVLGINWFLNLHIYISGKLMARYFFYAGFSVLQGRFTMAALADLGASIHTLGVPWAFIAFQNAYTDFPGAVLGMVID